MPARCNAQEPRFRLKPPIVALFLLASGGSCAVVPGGQATSTEGKIRVQAIQQTAWGEVDGKPVTLFTLTNERGLFVKIATYGGIITELHVPDATGKLAVVVLG